MIAALPPTWIEMIGRCSWQASILALAMLAAQPVLRRTVAARWRVALWIVVVCRFLPLAFPESRWSVFNWLPGETAQVEMGGPREVGARSRPPVAAPEVNSIAPKLTDSNKAEPLAAEANPARDSSPAAVANQSEASAKTTAAFLVTWRGVTWRVWISAIYLAGAGVVLLRWVLASIGLWRVIRRAAIASDGRVLASLDSARQAMGIRRALPLLITEDSAGPALVGYWRPRLLVPARVLSLLTAAELRLVFLHECAHLRRRDVLLNYLLAAVAAVHWFNPLVWVMARRVRGERELACDERVLQDVADPAPYGQALLKLVEFAGRGAVPLLTAVGIIETHSSLRRRIQMIATFRKPRRWVSIVAVGALAGVALGTLTGPQSRAAVPAPATAPSAQTSQSPGGSAAPAKTGSVVIPLKNLSPKWATALLEKLFKGADVNIAAADKAIVVSAPPNMMATISELVTQLDTPASGKAETNAAVNDPQLADVLRRIDAQAQALEAARPAAAAPADPLLARRLAVEMDALDDVQRKLDKAQTDLAIAEAQLEAVQAKVKSGAVQSTELSKAIQDDRQFSDLEQMLANLKIERSTTLAGPNPEAAAVRATDAKIRSVEELMAKRRAELESLTMDRMLVAAGEQVQSIQVLSDVLQRVLAQREAQVLKLQRQLESSRKSGATGKTGNPAKSSNSFSAGLTDLSDANLIDPSHM